LQGPISLQNELRVVRQLYQAANSMQVRVGRHLVSLQRRACSPDVVIAWQDAKHGEINEMEVKLRSSQPPANIAKMLRIAIQVSLTELQALNALKAEADRLWLALIRNPQL